MLISRALKPYLLNSYCDPINQAHLLKAFIRRTMPSLIQDEVAGRRRESASRGFLILDGEGGHSRTNPSSLPQAFIFKTPVESPASYRLLQIRTAQAAVRTKLLPACPVEDLQGALSCISRKPWRNQRLLLVHTFIPLVDLFPKACIQGCHTASQLGSSLRMCLLDAETMFYGYPSRSSHPLHSCKSTFSFKLIARPALPCQHAQIFDSKLTASWKRRHCAIP